MAGGVIGSRSPPNRSQNASASSALAKQNTTNSPGGELINCPRRLRGLRLRWRGAFRHGASIGPAVRTAPPISRCELHTLQGKERTHAPRRQSRLPTLLKCHHPYLLTSISGTTIGSG
jgi:hypothetical protein